MSFKKKKRLKLIPIENIRFLLNEIRENFKVNKILSPICFGLIPFVFNDQNS